MYRSLTLKRLQKFKSGAGPKSKPRPLQSFVGATVHGSAGGLLQIGFAGAKRPPSSFAATASRPSCRSALLVNPQMDTFSSSQASSGEGPISRLLHPRGTVRAKPKQKTAAAGRPPKLAPYVPAQRPGGGTGSQAAQKSPERAVPAPHRGTEPTGMVMDQVLAPAHYATQDAPGGIP